MNVDGGKEGNSFSWERSVCVLGGSEGIIGFCGGDKGMNRDASRSIDCRLEGGSE